MESPKVRKVRSREDGAEEYIRKAAEENGFSAVEPDEASINNERVSMVRMLAYLSGVGTGLSHSGDTTSSSNTSFVEKVATKTGLIDTSDYLRFKHRLEVVRELCEQRERELAETDTTADTSAIKQMAEEGTEDLISAENKLQNAVDRAVVDTAIEMAKAPAQEITERSVSEASLISVCVRGEDGHSLGDAVDISPESFQKLAAEVMSEAKGDEIGTGLYVIRKGAGASFGEISNEDLASAATSKDSKELSAKFTNTAETLKPAVPSKTAPPKEKSTVRA